MSEGLKGKLTCGAQWCTPCPNGWAEGAACRESDAILDKAEQYSAQAQAALDWYDFTFPEDFLGFYGSDGQPQV